LLQIYHIVLLCTVKTSTVIAREGGYPVKIKECGNTAHIMDPRRLCSALQNPGGDGIVKR